MYEIIVLALFQEPYSYVGNIRAAHDKYHTL